MLGPIFRAAFRQTSKFPVFLNIPTQSFANTAPKVTKKSTEAPKPRLKKGNPFKNVKLLDPTLVESVRPHVPGFCHEEAARHYRYWTFDKHVAPALEVYKKLGFSGEQIRQIVKRQPSLLGVYRTKPNVDIEKLYKLLKENYNLYNSHFSAMFFKNPWIGRLTFDDLQKKCQWMEETLKMTKKEIRRIFILYPTTFNCDLNDMIEKFRILREYLNIDPRKMGIIAARHTFFFRNKTEYLKGNVKLLLGREFTPDQIVEIMMRHAEVFVINPGNVQISFQIPERAHMTPKDIAKTFTAHPRLLSIDATTIQPRKIKFFRRFGIQRFTASCFMIDYPRIYIKSANNIYMKMTYLIQRMGLYLRGEKAFPAILNYDYATVIRPRGEMMLDKKVVLPWVEVLKMSDDTFVQRVGGTKEELEKSKRSYKTYNNELDWKQRFYSKMLKGRGKYARY